MSIVSCASCGMQFNAAGYQPGVQFQCTQCGAMVTVGGGGAPAPAGRPGAKRATGMQKRGPGAGPRAARGGPPQRGTGIHVGVEVAPGLIVSSELQRGGKPSAGLFVGIGVGVVVIGIIIAVVVMSSGPSPEQASKSAADQKFETQKEEQAKKDAEIKANNDAIKTTMNAAMDRGTSIESALRSGDKAALEGMFDWTAYAAYLSDLAAKDPKFLASGPLFSTGEWFMDGTTPKWKGAAVHGPESLKAAVMGYIEKYLFGSPEVKWIKAAAEDAQKGGFSGVKINGREYMGKFISVEVKGAGKIKEFWVGAPKGDAGVKIINFKDQSALNALQQEFAKANRPAVDDRNPMRDDRDTTRPDDPKDPKEEPGEEGPIEDGPVDEDLPAVAKTGAMPKEAALVNILNQLKDGNKLKPAQKNSMTSAKAEDRKAMMGALIDALSDAHNAGKRREKAMISDAMMQVWGNFARNAGFADEDMVYDVDGRNQSDTDDPIRRWIKVYNGYNPK